MQTLKITERMKYIDWDDTLLEQDTLRTFSTFHENLCQIYEKCFSVRKMNKEISLQQTMTHTSTGTTHKDK